MRRAGPLVLLLVVVGCDGPIRGEMVALLETTPPPAASACAGRDARRERLEPVRALVAQAYRARPRFDDPLPAALEPQLLATPLTATTVADWRCLMADLHAFDPKVEPNYAVGLGTLAALFFDQGTALLAAGKTDAGWQHVEQGLRLYARPTAVAYLYFLGAQYFLARTRGLATRFPPSTAVRAQLLVAGADATMTRATFCRGLNEELLAHAASLFYGHFAAEHPRLAARWGPAAVAHLDASWARNQRPGRQAWRAYAGVVRVVRAGCADAQLDGLEQRARDATRAVAAVDRSPTALLEVTWQRFGHFRDLEAIGRRLESTLLPARGEPASSPVPPRR